jgi:hypothetical protein
MRKMFWGFGICGAMLTAAVVASANHAARHPNSFIGRVMHGASYAASKLNPAAGFGPVLASLKKKDMPAEEVEGIPDDPVPIDDASARESVNTLPAVTAAIVIPDDDQVSPVEPRSEVESNAFRQIDDVIVIETPAPAIMPFCHDEEECEVLPMPMIEEECAEEEMPTVCISSDAGLVGSIIFESPIEEGPKPREELSEEGPKPREEPSEEPAPESIPTAPNGDECREDPHRHHHHSGCPYTGRSYGPTGGCPRGPSCDPPKPATGDEESSESEEIESASKSALKKIRQYKSRKPIDFEPTFPSVDTMEMRPSDRQLYDYGPGVL